MAAAVASQPVLHCHFGPLWGVLRVGLLCLCRLGRAQGSFPFIFQRDGNILQQEQGTRCPVSRSPSSSVTQSLAEPLVICWRES